MTLNRKYIFSKNQSHIGIWSVAVDVYSISFRWLEQPTLNGERERNTELEIMNNQLAHTPIDTILFYTLKQYMYMVYDMPMPYIYRKLSNRAGRVVRFMLYSIISEEYIDVSNICESFSD